jgi:hypothetical protein
VVSPFFSLIPKSVPQEPIIYSNPEPE